MDQNTFDTIFQILTFVVGKLPAAYATNVWSTISFLCSLCILIRFIWCKLFKPPAPGTALAAVFNVITRLSGMVGFNAPSYGPGYKSIKVGVDMDREEAEKALRLSPGSSATKNFRPPTTQQ